MTRKARLIWRLALGGLALAAVLTGVTSLGPWAGTRLLGRLVATRGWRLEVAEHAGSLAGGFSLGGLVAANKGLGLRIAVERLEVSPWSYAVDAVRPEIRLELVARAAEEDAGAAELEEAPPPRLPVEYLPQLSVDQARLEIRWADTRRELRGDGLSLRYHTLDDTSGLLTLVAPQLVLVGADGSSAPARLALSARLSPSLVEVDSLGASGDVDSLRVEAAASGRLALVPGLPAAVRLNVGMQTRSAALRGELEAIAEGGLQPVDLEIALQGRVDHPTLQTVDLAARVEAGMEEVVLDSLWLGLLGGELEVRATYHPDADSLQGQVSVRQVELARLPGSIAAGAADGQLQAAFNLKERRYVADLEMTLRGFDVLPGGPVDLRLQASRGPDGDTRVAMESPVLELAARGWADPVGWAGPAGAYDLALEGVLRSGPLIDLDAAPVHLEGRVRPDSVQLRLKTPRLPGELGGRFGDAVLEVGLVENRFLEAAFTLEEDLLALRLGLDIARGEVDSLVSLLSPLALDRLVPGVQGEVRGRVWASGALDVGELRLVSGFETPGVGYAGWRTGPLTLRLGYENRLATCVLGGPGLRIETRMDADKNLSGRAEFDGAVLRQEAEDQLALTGALTWKGNLDQEMEAHLRLEEMVWRQGGWEVSAAQPLRMRYAAGRLHVESVLLQTPVGPLRAVGSVRADTLDLTAEFSSLDLRQVMPPLSFEGEGDLSLGGTVQKPRVQGRVDLRQVYLDTLELGEMQVRLTLEDSLALRAALFQRGGEGPAAEAALDLPAAPLFQGIADTTSGAVRLRLTTRKADLSALLTYALEQATQGWLDLESDLWVPVSRLDSSLTWSDFSGDIVFEGLQVKTVVETDSLRLEMVPGGQVLLHDDRLEAKGLQVEVERHNRDTGRFVPGGSLRLEGSLQGSAFSRLTLALEEVDLLLFDGPEGQAHLQALIGGTPQEPELDLDLVVETQDLGEVRGGLQGDARGAEWWLTWTTLLEDSLVVRGRLPWDLEAGRIALERGRMHVQSEGIGLFVFADQFADLDHLDGRIGADLRVEGLGEGMSFAGYAQAEDLEFSLLDIKPVYVFPTGRLEFEGSRAEFRDFVSPARKNNGRMELSGHVDLTVFDEPRFSARLETKNLVCQYEDIFKAPDIDMALTLVGSRSGSRLAGDIRLNKPLAEPVLVTFNAPPVPPPPPTLRDDFLENMALGVLVDIRDLKVDSELAEVEVSGVFDVSGTFYKPTFQGGLEISEGQVFILNRQFDFERGRIVLNSLVPTRSILDVAYDPLILNPELDMTATCKVIPIDDNTEHTVTMSIRGPAQTAAPEFASTPALDFNDIFRLLAFGSVSSQLEYTTALGTAAGQLLRKRVEKVGLDEFTVLPSGTVIGTVGQPSLRMGKYFDEIPFPLWVRYEAAVTEMSSGEVRLEHKLKPYLTVTGTAQSKYDRYGLGIGLKKDF